VVLLFTDLQISYPDSFVALSFQLKFMLDDDDAFATRFVGVTGKDGRLFVVALEGMYVPFIRSIIPVAGKALLIIVKLSTQPWKRPVVVKLNAFVPLDDAILAELTLVPRLEKVKLLFAATSTPFTNNFNELRLYTSATKFQVLLLYGAEKETLVLLPATPAINVLVFKRRASPLSLPPMSNIIRLPVLF
jgi:hypothetical protein